MDEEKIKPAGKEPAPLSRHRPVSALFLIAILLLVYNSNMRGVRIDDSLPARLLPFSVLLDHTLNLDRWSSRFQFRSPGHNIYFVKQVHGHWYSAYPVILPVVLTPLYIVPAGILAKERSSPVVEGALTPLLIDTMAKLSASLIAALSAAILYLALRKKAGPALSLLIALVYGLASNNFSTSSQALWRHGFTALCYSFLLWALWGDSSDTRRAFCAGLALGGATANKPAEVVLLLPFLLYFARRSRKEFAACLIPEAILGVLVLAYNFHYFGSILGGYPNPLVPPLHPIHPPVRTPLWVGVAGLMVSPSRGLLIYSPWTVFSLWGAAIMWRENSYGWARYLMTGMIVVYILQAGLGQWWGGWSFGPRYMAGLLPFFAVFLLPVLGRIRASRLLQGAAVAAVVVSLWVQVVGAYYYYPNDSWDSTPTFVEYAPNRLWNWSDTQLSRTWGAGPAHPLLPYEWINYFKKFDATDRSRSSLHAR